ncbi:MAG: MFS transporter [Pseudomonadota bacterium]
MPKTLSTRGPAGLPFILWGQFLERAAFFSMEAGLVFFLVDSLGLDPVYSAKTYQFFLGFSLFVALFVGWLADNRLGRFRAILYFSMPAILGYLMLGEISQSLWVLPVLALISLGAAAVRPNAAALAGSLFGRHHQEKVPAQAYGRFYQAINAGAATACLAAPLVRSGRDVSTVLLLPLILMTISFFVFIMGRRFFPEEPLGFQPRLPSAAGRARNRRQLKTMAFFFLFIAIFWFLAGRATPHWPAQVGPTLDLELFSLDLTLTAEQARGLKLAVLALLVWPFNFIWSKWEERRNEPIRPAAPRALGLGVAALAAVGLGLVAGDGPGSPWADVAGAFLFLVAELLIVIPGLKLTFTLAGDHQKSLALAVFFLLQFPALGLTPDFLALAAVLPPEPLYMARAVLLAGAGTVLLLAQRPFHW